MRIALDATYSVGSSLSGVGIYSRELMEGLAAAHPEARFLWCYRPHRFLRAFRAEGAAPNVSRRPLVGTPPGDLFHALNQRVFGSPKRAVCTFHDLFVMTGDYSTPEFRARFTEQAREAARRSHLILAVSAFTAEQVTGLLGFDRKRIRVVPHGVHAPGAAPEDADRENRILFVGALQKRKNIARLVRAFSAAAPPGWKLVLAGSRGYQAEEALQAVADSRRRSDIELPGYVSPARLNDLMRRSRIFAFPSLDEGFGIPVLEAMAWGVPVLTSNRSALPEVAGDAALLVDPESEEAIVEGLRRLVGDADLRARLRAAGLERCRLYPWSRTCQETWAAYEWLLGQA